MQFGMIGWYVPLSMYPTGYGENPKVPLPFVALGSQKSGMVLHFLCFYGHPTLRDWFISEWSAWERATWTEKPRGSGERVGRRANQYKKSGKKLDMGKGCVRFKSLEDLALDTRGSASGSGTRQRTRMSHAKREVGAACALLLVQRRSRDNRPVGRTARSRNRSELRAYPRRSTWPITRRQGRSWARERAAPRSPR